MTTTRALSMDMAGAPFAAVDLPRRDLRPNDVAIEVAYAGICHSDIHTARDEWGASHFPLTPGHEVAGIVTAVGSEVTQHKVGERVGVGCMVDSCGECEYCQSNQEQFCLVSTTWTYNSQYPDGEWAAGGYSRDIVVAERFVFAIPDSLPLDGAAPLLCAGVTTYVPLRHWGAGPGKRVGIIGIGGLGHVAVKIAAAMGAEVTAITRSPEKGVDAAALGATNHLVSLPQNLREAAGSFDILLNTVSANLDMDSYLRLLRPNGVMVNVGLPENAVYTVDPRILIDLQAALAGSIIGGSAITQEMLDFCGEHGITATVETITGAEVNEAWDRVVAGQVRYRYVIDASTI